jgi:hypothetical protein
MLCFFNFRVYLSSHKYVMCSYFSYAEFQRQFVFTNGYNLLYAVCPTRTVHWHSQDWCVWVQDGMCKQPSWTTEVHYANTVQILLHGHFRTHIFSATDSRVQIDPLLHCESILSSFICQLNPNDSSVALERSDWNPLLLSLNSSR